MIRLKQLFTPVKSMGAEEAKEYIKDHKEGTFTLLDVHQSREYGQEHLPGSKFIPVCTQSGHDAGNPGSGPLPSICR